MLKIGIGEYYYTVPYGFEEGVYRIKMQGYDCMDYQEFVNTETELFQKDSIQFANYLREQALVCKQAGLEIYQTHGPWRYPPQDATVMDRAERFEKMIRAVEGTAILGCKNMVIHPIMPFGINDEGHEIETYDINLEFMGKLAEIGKANDVVICYENMPMPLLSMASVPACLKLVNEINSDYLKMCLDTGHSAITKNPPGEAARMIGREKLQALHIHDNNGKHDVHIHPYAGVIDWEDFCMALREIEFNGVMNLEIKTQKKLPRELRESEEKNLYRKIVYLSKLVSGEA